MENHMILLYEVLDCSEQSKGQATGMDKPQAVKEMLKSALEKDAEVTLDMSNMRSLSPSFAYEAFGKLYDIFGDSINSRLKFVNDERNLQERIYSALNRRKEVLRFQ
ncbi:STAS-like domain-containing protein [Bdellovibrio bacteriovorus]